VHRHPIHSAPLLDQRLSCKTQTRNEGDTLTIKITKRRALAFLAVLAIAISAGIAYSLWTTQVNTPASNGAVGSIAVTSQTPLTYPTLSGKLMPGQSGDAIVRLTTASSGLKIVGWSAGSGSATVTNIQNAPSCNPSDISSNLSVPAATGKNIPLTPGPASDYTLAGYFVAASGLPSQCQDATFTVVFPGTSLQISQ